MNQTGTIADRIRTTRLARGMTRTELAAKCEVREITIQRWETGANHPLGKYLSRLAAALDVSPLWLLGDPNGDKTEVAA